MIPVNKNGILLTMALSLSSILLMCSSGTPIIRSKMEILENVMDGIDPVFRPTALKLIENDVDTAFIGFVLRNPDTKFMEKLLKINVTGFLKKPTIHLIPTKNQLEPQKNSITKIWQL